MAAESGVRMMRNWGIEPVLISGVLTMSPLNVREAELATGLSCRTARDLQSGALTDLLDARSNLREVTVLRRTA